MSETLVLGGASWNRILHLDALPAPVPASRHARVSYEAAGSTGIGKALALKALGHEVVLHAALGEDADGARVRSFCAGRGLDLIVDPTAAPTPVHVNLMDPEGRRLSIFAEAGDPDPVIDTARLAPLIAAAKAIFVGITPSSVPLLPLVREAPGMVLVDLHDWDGTNDWHAPFLVRADVVQLSDENLADPAAVLDRLAVRAELVVLTRGRAGAVIRQGDRVLEVPPAAADMVDSNGAGDVFSVALWSALAGGRNLEAAARFAATAAAMAVEDRDLVPETLSRAGVEARMRADQD